MPQSSSLRATGSRTPGVAVFYRKSAVLYQLCHSPSMRLEEKWHTWYSTALFLYKKNSHYPARSPCRRLACSSAAATSSAAWPLQDIVSLQSFIVGVNHMFIVPPTCKAYPIVILLHDHSAIYAPPPDPSFVCHTAYKIGNGNIM